MTPTGSNKQQPDLWSYACQQYPGYKAELLAFQDKGLSVNDLLALSYARRYSLIMTETQWHMLAEGRTRQLLERVRRFRLGLPKTSPLRQGALNWELALERWDLDLLERCLRPAEQWRKQSLPHADLLNREDRCRLDELMEELSG